MLGVTGVLALSSIVGSVLRTVVTRREVVLHAGIRHEVRIPLAGATGGGPHVRVAEEAPAELATDEESEEARDRAAR